MPEEINRKKLYNSFILAKHGTECDTSMVPLATFGNPLEWRFRWIARDLTVVSRAIKLFT